MSTSSNNAPAYLGVKTNKSYYFYNTYYQTIPTTYSNFGGEFTISFYMYHNSGASNSEHVFDCTYTSNSNAIVI